MNIPVSEISRRLADQAETVCSRLLPGGRRVKGEWHAGNVDGGEGDSLKVHLSGPHAGNWVDWASPQEKGDLVDLWRVTGGLTAGEAVRQAKEFLGIVDPVFREKKTYARPTAASGSTVVPLKDRDQAMEYLVTHRGLTSSLIQNFKVSACSERSAIVFPCYDPQGELVNRSYRSLPREGKPKRVWQDTGCAPCLFGWHALPAQAYDQRRVLLCEGQIDCITWAQWGIPALSIPNGGGQTWIDHEWENLAAFDHLYISFDMDGPGKAMAEKAIARLGRHRCLIVSLPGKDANECLLQGCTSADAEGFVNQATAPKLAGLLAAKDMALRLRAEMAPKPEPFTLPFFRINFDDGLGLYFRPAEVTVWSGHPGQGKTTLLRFLAATLVSLDHCVFVASMEARAERELFKMFVLHTGGHATEEGIDPYLAEVGETLLFADTVGYIKGSVLMEMLWFAFQRHGATHFIIDSLMRIADLEEDYPAQGAFLTQLQDFAKKSSAHVHLVAHPRKTLDGNRPAKMDIKGSSGIFAATDNMVVVSRNPKKDLARKEGKPFKDWCGLHDTEVTVEKQRESGWEGTFALKFDARTYSYSRYSITGPCGQGSGQSASQFPEGVG